MNHLIENYLLHDYPNAYNQTFPSGSRLYMETTKESHFELRDKCATMLQAGGQGVALFSNTKGRVIEIIDFEKYIDEYLKQDKKHKTTHKGKKCDFIIFPDTGTDFLILNEVAERQEKYIIEGGQTPPKSVIARQQLKDSIDKLNKVPNFLKQFTHKVALFSFCLPKEDPTSVSSPMAESMEKFQLPITIANDITMEIIIAEGFIFEQRIYPMAYEIP